MDVKRYIWPLVLRYSVDQIWLVRKQAYFLFGKLMKTAITHSDLEFTNLMKDSIFKFFYSSPSSKGRVAFAQVCACLVQHVDYHWFAVTFGDLLLSLQSSSLKDIQIALKQSLEVVKLVHNKNMSAKDTTNIEEDQAPNRSSPDTCTHDVLPAQATTQTSYIS